MLETEIPSSAEVKVLLEKGPLLKKIFRGSVSALLRVLGWIRPKAAADCVRFLVGTPNRARTAEWEELLLGRADSSTITVAGKPVVCYRWSAGSKAILLCHGWGGRGSQLGQFIPLLEQKGFSVIAFDAPGHGRSRRGMSSVGCFVATINALNRVHGPFHAAIGHCFGALALLAALDKGEIRVDRIVAIGCFTGGRWLKSLFSKTLNIPDAIIDEALKGLPCTSVADLRDVSALRAIAGASARVLVVHDRDEPSIPYSHALALSEAGRNAELFTTSSLGHRHIIAQRTVIERSVEFCCQ